MDGESASPDLGDDPSPRPRRRSGKSRQEASPVRIDTEAVPAGTWGVDKTHSNIGFAVDYLAGTFSGTFSEFDAVAAATPT
jgi:polyisoprenoid-binding protein YceI